MPDVRLSACACPGQTGGFSVCRMLWLYLRVLLLSIPPQAKFMVEYDDDLVSSVTVSGHKNSLKLINNLELTYTYTQQSSIAGLASFPRPPMSPRLRSSHHNDMQPANQLQTIGVPVAVAVAFFSLSLPFFILSGNSTRSPTSFHGHVSLCFHSWGCCHVA